jgi:hypothetical protein
MKDNTEELIKLLAKHENKNLPETIETQLKKRGQSCIGESMLKKGKAAAKISKNDKEFLNNLSKTFKYLHIEGENIYVEYPKCFCHHVKGYSGKIPSSYCKCSEAWVQKLFETALKRPVKAEVKKSIIRGDNTCNIRVYL